MKLSHQINAGDRVTFKEGASIFGLDSETLTRKFGWVSGIVSSLSVNKYRYQIEFDDGSKMTISEDSLKDVADVRDCTLFKALNMCADCEDRFICYTIKKK